MCEKFPSLLYLLAFFPDTLRSWPQVCLSLQGTCKVSQKCWRKCLVAYPYVTKAKSLFVGSFEISSKKSLQWKLPIIFATKIQWSEVGQIPGAAVLLYVGYIRVCTSVAPKSTVFQSNLYCKTIIRFSPSFRKNIQHFHLISLLDLTLHTETNDDHGKLKEKHLRYGF